jgi:conjugal transfer pilin signal peptidase TrbI
MFYAPSTTRFKKGETLIKQVRGIPQDRVTREDRVFYVNGEVLGVAKIHSLTGTPLQLGPTGLIPNRKYCVGASHVNSYDSRYEEIGWIDEKSIVGVAYPLF